MELGSVADWFSGSMSAAAVVVALGGYWIANLQRKSDQRDRDETAARQLALKIMRVANLTADIHRHLHAPHDGAPMEGVWADQKWRRIRGLIGLTDEPSLALDGAQEDMLIRAKANELLINFMLSVSRYHSLSANMQDYNIKRDALLQLHPAPIQMDGLHAVHAVDANQLMQLMPYARSLESQLDNLIEMSEENRELTRGLFPTYNETMKVFFKGTKMPTLAEPQTAGAAPQPQQPR